MQQSAIRLFQRSYPLRNRQPELTNLDLNEANQLVPIEDDQLIQNWLSNMGFSVSFPTGDLLNNNAIASAYYASEE